MDETAEVVSLEIGRVYAFVGIGAGVGKPILKDGKRLWVFPPSLYRLLAVSVDYRTGQDKIAYMGVRRDHDLGKHHTACLRDWHEQFRLVPQKQPAERGEAGASTEPVKTGAEHGPDYKPHAGPGEVVGERGP